MAVIESGGGVGSDPPQAAAPAAKPNAARKVRMAETRRKMGAIDSIDRSPLVVQDALAICHNHRRPSGEPCEGARRTRQRTLIRPTHNISMDA